MEIGQIVNTSGLKGLLKVVPYTDDIKRFEELKSIYIVIKKDHQKEFEITEVRDAKGMVYLKLKGIDTIEEAEKYKGCYIVIDRKDAVKLPKDSYFIVDMIGLSVYNEEGELLGELQDVFSTKSNDIYVVKDKLGKQILLPAIESVIKKIDMDNRKMIVHVMEGLME